MNRSSSKFRPEVSAAAMGKSSWKRRVKETATTQNSGSGAAEGDGGWRFLHKEKFILNFSEDVYGDKPLQCIKDNNAQCRCIAIEAKHKG